MNPALKRAVRAAKRDMVPENYVKRVIQFARQGYTSIEFQTYDTRLGFRRLSHRLRPNSNNSISLKDDFLRAVDADGPWNLTARKDGKVMKTLKAPICGRRSAMPPGLPPIRASTSTRR